MQWSLAKPIISAVDQFSRRCIMVIYVTFSQSITPKEANPPPMGYQLTSKVLVTIDAFLTRTLSSNHNPDNILIYARKPICLLIMGRHSANRVRFNCCFVWSSSTLFQINLQHIYVGSIFIWVSNEVNGHHRYSVGLLLLPNHFEFWLWEP